MSSNATIGNMPENPPVDLQLPAFKGSMGDPCFPGIMAQDNLGPNGLAVGVHPDKGELHPLFFQDDLGSGTTIFIFPPPPWHVFTRQESHLGQGIFDALKVGPGGRSRYSLSQAGVENLFYRGLSALREKGMVEVNAKFLPWGDQHPSSEPHPTAQPWFKKLGQRFATLGRGNQWVGLFKIHGPTNGENLIPGGLLLAVHTGARGAASFENLPQFPVPLAGPLSEKTWPSLGRIQTFGQANRMTIATICARLLEKSLGEKAIFHRDIPCTAVEQLTIPWHGRLTSLVLMRRGVALGESLVRGPMSEFSSLMAGPDSVLLPVDGGFLNMKSKPQAAPNLGPRWLFASDSKNTRMETYGLRKSVTEVVQGIEESGKAQVLAQLEPRLMILA